ncbi:MAG: MerR family transcriptional regulator [Parvularculaceae bacterium]
MAKSAEAFRTISEAASELDVPQHVLRHWEEVFGQIRPMRRAGGRRYYRPVDIDLLRGVRVLLYDERYTTKGVQKIFKENGVKYVAELGRMAAEGRPIELRAVTPDDPPENVSAPAGDPAPGDDAPTATAPLAPAALPEEARRALTSLLARLEDAQDALDEAAIALDAIDAARFAETRAEAAADAVDAEEARVGEDEDA